MNKTSSIIVRLHLVEVLVALLIIGIPISFILRILYAHRMIEWEDRLFESIGIPAVLVRFVCVLGFFGVLVTLAVRGRRKRKKQMKAGYELPKPE